MAAAVNRRRTPVPPAPPASADDARLFREAVGHVRPLSGDVRAPVPRPPPSDEPVQFLADEARVRDELLAASPDALAMQAGEALSFLRDGHDPRLLRRLRGGQFAVQDEIDLHCVGTEMARSMVREFLAEALASHRRCVRIIHGKGLRSPQGPVIKALVDRLLRQHGDVLAFASAPAAQGGTGAVLVLLRAR
ncbi:MAG: Smr/MutS family protein [Xanthomonadales bacterium]|nr:Smr/MutS family protein [Xanthomonadales bacterium]